MRPVRNISTGCTRRARTPGSCSTRSSPCTRTRSSSNASARTSPPMAGWPASYEVFKNIGDIRLWHDQHRLLATRCMTSSRKSAATSTTSLPSTRPASRCRHRARTTLPRGEDRPARQLGARLPAGVERHGAARACRRSASGGRAQHPRPCWRRARNGTGRARCASSWSRAIRCGC